MQITSFLVRSISLHANELQWTVAQLSEDPWTYTFQIYRSESIEGPYETISPVFSDKYYFIDNQLPLRSDLRIFYYKLRTTDAASAYQDTEPAYIRKAANLYALEIARCLREGLRYAAGTKLYVLPVRTFGKKCSCFDQVTGKRTKALCGECFPPGALVRTQKGYKQIETIKVGDAVLTEDGEFYPVVRMFVSNFDGYLSTIMPSVSTSAISSTPAHPFRVLRGHKINRPCGPKCNGFINRGDGTGVNRPLDIRQISGGKWHARVGDGCRGKRKALGLFVNKTEAEEAIRSWRKEHYPPRHQLVWDAAEGLTPGDWLVAKWPREIRDLDVIEIPEKYRGKSNKNKMRRLGPTSFRVDKEFLWMVGLYLAEGSTGDRTLSFGLHKEEKEFQNRLLRFFRAHGYHPSISSRDGNGIQVLVHGTSLAEWFPVWLGRGCASKRIPEELMLLPPDKAHALLDGIYDGDGLKEHFSITQTSEILALQISELCHRLGYQPLVTRQISRVVTPKGNSRRPAYRTDWFVPARYNYNRKGRWRLKGELLTKIRDASRTYYKGPVYNLEVAKNHTYVVNGVVVHNCHNTGFSGGFLTAIETYGQVGAHPKREALLPAKGAVVTLATSIIRLVNYPIIKPDDVILDPQDNTRWRVVSVTPSMLTGTLISQVVQCALVDYSDVEYKIELDGLDVFQLLEPELLSQKTVF